MDSFKNIIGDHFNLHPLDLIQHSNNIVNSLGLFVNSFKDRIQLELDYSKSLLKLSKNLQKNIKPNKPTPLSYISSALKVQHEQRARHAVQLAQYLHTQIEAPCKLLLEKNQSQIKLIQKQIKQYYKQGQHTEEDYQKNIRKFYKSSQQWQQKIIERSILNSYSNSGFSKKDKTPIKLDEQKLENKQIFQKYLRSLQQFNKFAQRYNRQIGEVLKGLQIKSVECLKIQTVSIRKLIVSEISMFKNIQYDLINISKQMQEVVPQQQISFIVEQHKAVFKNPILSIYSQGPILQNRHSGIDYKRPMNQSLLSGTLTKMEDGIFHSIVQNKSNSTLRYSVQKLLQRYQGKIDPSGNQFLTDFEEIVRINKVIKILPIEKTERNQRNQLLNPQEAFSTCLQVVSIAGQYLQPYEMVKQKEAQRIQLIRTYLSVHHFYRFIVLITLQQYANIFEGKIKNTTSILHFSQIITLLLEQSWKFNDVFIIRHAISLIFKSAYCKQDQLHYFYQIEEIRALDYWSNKSLWDALIFEGCYQLISLLPSTNKAELKQVLLMKQKNVIFSQLLLFSHYMVILGLQTSEVRSIIGRFSQIYNLYEQHEKDLAKNIASSRNQYKKLFRSKV